MIKRAYGLLSLSRRSTTLRLHTVPMLTSLDPSQHLPYAGYGMVALLAQLLATRAGMR